MSEHEGTETSTNASAAGRYLRRGGRVVRDHGLWLTAVLSVGVFLALFLLGDAGAVADAISDVDRRTLAAVFALVTMGYLVRFAKWAYYLRELGIELPLRSSALAFFCGLMLVVTPGKVGEVWKAWFLRDLEGIEVSRVTAVVGAERVTDLLALTGLASLGVLLYDQSATLLAAVVLVFLGGVLLLQWRSACLSLIERSRAVPMIEGYADEVESFYEGSYALFRPRPLLVSTAISLVAWGLEGIALWLVLESLGTGASVLEGLFVFGLGSVVGALSLLPGGLAATEASMVGALLALGHSRPVAAAATLVIRVGTLWYGACVGVTVFGLYRLSSRRE